MNRNLNSLQLAKTDPKTSIKPITELFAQQVQRRGENIAVLFENHVVSYRELDETSNQIANKLLELELAPESRIGVCLNRSHHAIAAMLGILKAGLAFVPLDPDYPVARLEYMIVDAAIECCISEEIYQSLITPLVKTVFLTETAFNSSKQSGPDIALSPNQLAYVMYTSGSTGNPKGVQIEHEALSNYSLADVEIYELTDVDCTLQFSTLNFDIAIEEIFPPLISGSRIAVRPQRRSDDLNELSALIQRYKVTAIHIATAYWHEWVNMLDATSDTTPESIRLMIVTGEKVSSEHYRHWLSMTRQPVLWANAYGPTETTVTATVYIPPPCWSGTNLPIGRPLKGYTAYILDSQLNPVEANSTGELYIGGASLARGYLNRPDLNESVFIIAPTGERLYKTGDLARWAESGDIEYAGRIDHQIKIGSFRIEPGEIEEALNRHPAILESLVIATDSTSTDSRRIIAYTGSSNSPTAAELHNFLSDEIPVYMLPAAYVLMEQLPKTLNGKIDRDALPELSNAQSPVQTEFVAPRNKLERKLENIWSDVLGRPELSINDDFFSVGGSSLKVTRTLTMIHKKLGHSPSARAFYANPTIAGISELLSDVSDAPSTYVVPGSSLTRDVELTDNQYQVWFQQKLFPELTIYNIYEAVAIEGDLDVARLKAAINEAISRHPILDVEFEEKDGRCYQKISSKTQDKLNVVDNRQADVERWVEEQIHLPFDLATDRKYRFSLLQHDEGKFVLVLTVHHIIADGWSMTLLIRDIGNLYNHSIAPSTYVQPSVAESFEFADVALFARDNKSSKEHSLQLEYWTNQLLNKPPVQLPQTIKGPANRQYTASEVKFDICVPRDKLDSVCHDYAISPFMLLLGVFKALLYRYTTEENIPVAIAHSGRAIAGVENTFGLLVNTLIATTRIDSTEDIGDFLTRVRKTSLDAFANQDISLSELVTALKPERIEGSMPLTQFLFLMQDIPDTDMRLHDLETSSITTPALNIDYDILLEMTEQRGDPNKPYSARLVFADELYDLAEMQRATEHFQNLLQAMTDRSDLPIASLPMLSSDEISFLQHSLNQTEFSYPASSSLIDEISKVALREAEGIAVTFESESISYRELMERVKQLAGHLYGLGVEPNTIVAVFMDRSADMLIALLAIQYAGAAYLPMDPLYPEERISYIMQDAKAPVLITQNSFEEAIPELTASIVRLDGDAHVIEHGLPLHKSVPASPSDLAYVIYTSGSTGKPKGVQITRQNVLNFLFSMKQRPGFQSSDSLLALTTISFDIAVLELYLPLISGGTVDIVSRETAINGTELANRIEQTGATVLQATPATWRLLLETNWKPDRQFKALVGGEALPKDLIEPMLKRVDELWNMYGPTETTVWSTCSRIDNALATPSIGTPIGNTEIYILADNDQLAPMGVPGELCIGGHGVALGYSNQPTLTGEKFIQPLWAEGNRIYRTGDSARWLSDGTIDFLGRLDNQIKLRGYRIEPGEIEKCISATDDVEQAVVTVNGDEHGDFLTGYLVCSKDIDYQSLREQLTLDLPDYMIPSSWVTLQTLPLTPNGKIDRKSLPKPPQRTGTRSASNPLRSETEKVVASLWQEMLDIAMPGRDDNFFALGGHSLLGMRFIAKAKSQFGVSLPVRSLMTDNLSRIAVRLMPHDNPTSPEGKAAPADITLPVQIIDTESREDGKIPLHGMLHTPQDTINSQSTDPSDSRAILICQPIGHEYLRLHKALQRLSCELARKGHTVLRFDYYGTGDSPGAFCDARLERWKRDITNSAMYLTEKTGKAELTLIGARIGAPIMLAAQLENVGQTILWDPVRSGNRWLDEQRKLHRHEMRNLDRYRWTQRKTDPDEMIGYQYSRELVRDLNHLELGSTAKTLKDNTVIISSNPKSTVRSLLPSPHQHSLDGSQLVRVNDGQRWSNPISVNDMILGLGAIRTIIDGIR